ncbi:MAG: L-glutamate gamma-semialdehyde dehydrogenase [Burkholderiales bacterium]|nr:L-glutamate gamma-semialdehyde dehydrogenase [Anaerolineae bacterium]
MLPAYRPEALTDFSQPANVEAFAAAVESVRTQLGQSYPMIIGGQEVWSDNTFDSTNPARPADVVATFPQATIAQAQKSIDLAHEAYLTWRFVPADERARFLLVAAAEMRRRKHEFSAWMVFEAGKSWYEADADTSEAIDFLEYYARQMMRMTRAHEFLAIHPPEELGFEYIALGAVACIPPWNFPNAIPAGMMSAALVAGNGVVLKPAEDTPTIAYKMCELFWDQGLPAGLLNFITANPGGAIGDALVDYPKTRLIAFTGSKVIGQRIFERAAKVHPGQLWLKRTVLEMGGKDAVVVDETADLASAAQGIVASAFGFQGQKCSAGSRAIIARSVYEEVVGMVVEGARKLTVGETDQGPTVDMGPVINRKAFDKIMGYVEHGRQNHTLLLGGEAIETDTNGYFIQPTIFGDVSGDAKIAQEEIFGPVLSIIPANDFEDLLRIANSTEYGLTGAFYSRDRARIEQARREFHVGNLYLNRKATGAIVGVHPFGGFNMSGTDSKGGGPDYLLLFTQAKSIAEKL